MVEDSRAKRQIEGVGGVSGRTPTANKKRIANKKASGCGAWDERAVISSVFAGTRLAALR